MIFAFRITTAMSYNSMYCSIQPVLLVNPCNEIEDESRFRGVVDVIAINKGSITYHKDVSHASENQYSNGWVYADEVEMITQNKIQEKAYMKALGDNYDTLSPNIRKMVDLYCRKEETLPF